MLQMLNDTFPDSLTGTILAIEGVRDAAVVLNGPTGCKFYHGSISEAQLPRQGSLDPIAYAEEFYFGQPRVPCTYLDGEDYIYGSEKKLTAVLPRMLGKGHSLVGIVNSPGASLIGDEISRMVADAGLDARYLTLESSDYSGRLVEGFQKGVLCMLEELCPQRERPREKVVNLTGLSLYHLGWEGSVAHLRDLLQLCDLEVGCVLCAGSTVEELEKSAEAEFNIVVHEEYADRISRWYEDKYGIPWVFSEEGAPIGFESIESWLSVIGMKTGADVSGGVDALTRARKRCKGLISRFNSLTGLPKGCTFAIKGDASMALPITKFLYSYLGMTPECVLPSGTSSGSFSWGRLETFLEGHGLDFALSTKLEDVDVDIILGDGNLVSVMVARGRADAGMAISLPNSRPLDLLGRPMLGLQGTLYLLDQVLNGLCGDQHFLI